MGQGQVWTAVIFCEPFLQKKIKFVFSFIIEVQNESKSEEDKLKLLKHYLNKLF